MYLLKICDPVRERVQRRQRESVHKGSGFIDSRWEVTINALVETNGLTIVIARLRVRFLSWRKRQTAQRQPSRASRLRSTLTSGRRPSGGRCSLSRRSPSQSQRAARR